MTWDRAAFIAFNAGVQRAREAYEAEPTACAHWCVECVRPAGTTIRCEHCKDTRRSRDARARRRKATT